jgi:hypothetical protein
VNVHIADFDASLQSHSDRIRNAGLQTRGARSDDEQCKDHGPGHENPPVFGLKFHRTNRKVRRQRVSSKK